MRLPAFALAALVLAQPAAAQVGYPPEKSPFRDINKKWSLTALYGRLGGDGGKVGIGPHDGPTYGGRLEMVLGTPVAAALTVSHGSLVRDVVNVDSLGVHRTGPYDQSVLMVEGALQLNITGKKTWHRLAPFIGISAGWVHGSASSAVAKADSSGFEFGNKFYWSPSAGTRLFLTRRMFLRGDARYVSWKLSYPTVYARNPSQDPNIPIIVIPDGKLDEWDGAFEWRVGLGFSF
ncbi:MAG: hypothetical protein E4H38_01650 [Gemmatimonadales bacterium]|jgi:hypothetical protein|nr:MAG: hypothetical protein E4H38_01650 [Gemmatimonadales bacterium]